VTRSVAAGETRQRVAGLRNSMALDRSAECAGPTAGRRRRRWLGCGLRGRRARGGRVGWVRRCRPRDHMAAEHDHQCLVGHQDDDGTVRADPGRSWRPRSGGTRWPVLARVRHRRQGEGAGAAPALAHGGPARLGRADRRALRLAVRDGTPGRAGSAVGTGDRGRIPLGHPGVPRGRGRTPDHRPEPGRILRAGGGGAAGCGLPHRTIRRARPPRGAHRPAALPGRGLRRERAAQQRIAYCRDTRACPPPSGGADGAGGAAPSS
jgi:hypothetical protein